MKGLILDTNLLLVYLIGCYDVDYITHFTRTSAYTSEDFNKLRRYIKNFNALFVTPQILTELSHFSEEVNESKLNSYFEVLIKELSNFKEEYIDENIILSNKESLIKFGFADCSIVEAAKRNSLTVLTTDFPLSGSMKASDLKALNWVDLLFSVEV